MRWILVQIANAASKKLGSKLRRFYLRVKARSGHNVAIIALARKILCILHHLLMNREKYVEDDGSKKSRSKKNYRTSFPRVMAIQEMIDIIRQSGYEVQKVNTSEGASMRHRRNGRRKPSFSSGDSLRFDLDSVL
jgi:hypothetical protein